ncbi:unnamed protein product [Coffea canephora]|uniref:Transcription factor CBF/NF-Y/archaeal histone domain-containing protein n=3 Tax=Coffea TaxID=13442 RepID=A0A068V0C8_COFCA|nr:unnamed protein product [Coffea canephora]
MMAEHEEQNAAEETHRPGIPTHRVKKIMKLDKEIKKVNSEAVFLISNSTQLFLQFLAEKSAQVVLEKKKKTIKLEHLRAAVKRHLPTSDFLLDSLPPPAQPSDQLPKDRPRPRSSDKPVPPGSRRIDAFFNKCN